MKLGKYLKDKFIYIFLYVELYAFSLFFLLIFKSSLYLIIFITIFFFAFLLLVIGIDYFKKKAFYNDIVHKITKLDKKYLLLEMISEPTFYEGKIFCDVLYEVNKSMLENIKDYEINNKNFKEYIEMWVHEVKIPLSSLTLLAHNHENAVQSSIMDKVKEIDNYTEQVLYYTRVDISEKDYLIKENNLDKIISSVIIKNKNDILSHNINLITSNISFNVYTDSKWLEFILGQIINNSIKYSKKNKSSCIKIYAECNKVNNKKQIILNVYDNGIGIPKRDITRVFDKSFTGSNGRKRAKTTGMGLYIAKNLCVKLGHKISIESEENKYTLLKITFENNDYYDVLK